MNQKGIGNRLLSLVLMMAMVISLLPGMGITVHADTAVTGVTLSSSAQTINVGDKVSFTATVSPEGATDKTVIWSVGGTGSGVVELYSDENCDNKVTDQATSILTVYAKGISAGSATVTCTSNENANMSATSTVTVNAAATVTAYSVTITAGNNMTLADGSGDASQTGVTGAITNVVFNANTGYIFPATSDSYKTENGITVARTSDTVVTVSGTPTADVTLTIPDAISASAISNNVDVTGISLNYSSIALTVNGEDDSLDYTLTPESPTSMDVVFTSSNNNVASYENGCVKAKGLGTATITATATNGTDIKDDDQTATCEVTVGSGYGGTVYKTGDNFAIYSNLLYSIGSSSVTGSQIMVSNDLSSNTVSVGSISYNTESQKVEVNLTQDEKTGLQKI